jgi:hypothetical protein
MGVTSAWDAAIVTRLEASAPLVAAVVGVYAGVAPQAADSGALSAFPYIVIDDTDFVDYHTASESGFEIFMRVYTFSRSPGRKETRDIQDLIYDALHRQQGNLSVTGHSVLLIDREGSTVDDAGDTDGSWRGVCEYRALVTKNAAD